MVEMYHPELDRTIEVQELAVYVYERSGWVRTDEPEEAQAGDAQEDAPEIEPDEYEEE